MQNGIVERAAKVGTLAFAVDAGWGEFQGKWFKFRAIPASLLIVF
jgi:hypothetical protein